MSHICDACGATFDEPARHENKEYRDYGGRGAWVTESWDEACPECDSDRISADPLPDLLLLAEHCEAMVIDEADGCEVIFDGPGLRAFAKAIKEGKA